MVDRIVEQVAREALHGDSLVVAAIAGSLPLHASNAGEGLAQSALGVDEFGGYR